MVKTTHPQKFFEGDRVCHVAHPPGTAGHRVGTFVMYCKGYRSHCLVQWPGDGPLQRTKVDHLSLVERVKV